MYMCVCVCVLITWVMQWTSLHSDHAKYQFCRFGGLTSAKFRAWLDRAQLFAKLKPTNILFSLIEANLPNLIPTKFSGYTVRMVHVHAHVHVDTVLT